MAPFVYDPVPYQSNFKFIPTFCHIGNYDQVSITKWPGLKNTWKSTSDNRKYSYL